MTASFWCWWSPKVTVRQHDGAASPTVSDGSCARRQHSVTVIRWIRQALGRGGCEAGPGVVGPLVGLNNWQSATVIDDAEEKQRLQPSPINE